jgi:hypothetical protein
MADGILGFLLYTFFLDATTISICNDKHNIDIYSNPHIQPAYFCHATNFNGVRKPQSIELTRAAPELRSSAISFIEGVHNRRKSAACPKFDMIWQHRSPITVVRSGGGGEGG